MPASTTTFSAAISHRKPADIAVPATPPTCANPELGRTTAPNTARAATVIPAPTRTTTLECPAAKKKPVASGRCPSASSLRVVLSIAAMWSASKAWRQPSVQAVSAAPRPTPRPPRRTWWGSTASTNIPQPPALSARTMASIASTLARARPVSTG